MRKHDLGRVRKRRNHLGKKKEKRVSENLLYKVEGRFRTYHFLMTSFLNETLNFFFIFKT